MWAQISSGEGGRRLISDLIAREALPASLQDSVAFPHHRHNIDVSRFEERENPDGTCGPNVGSCAAGRCCSLVGVAHPSWWYCHA